ncbi:MAG: S8 family serine peptidase [Candidatus Eisenbacteria bacterium]
MSRRLALTLVILVCAALLAGSASAKEYKGSYMAGQVIVKFKSNANAAERAAVKSDLRGNTKQRLSLIDAELWDISGYTVEQAVNKYKGNSKIQYIEPNYVLFALETPNDPRFSELWGLNNTGQTGGTADADIDAPQAWDVFTGSSSVLVCIIDTGLDYNHPDLAANAWTNPGEIAGNGIDDDGNGHIDDIHGWDFYNNDNDPFDDHGHGTHCAGTIGGVGNNGIGVAGVNWTVKIMSCKFLSSGGSGSTTGAINSIEYALTIPNLKIMSNSWGGGGFSQALMDAITAAYNHGVLFVCAGGNYVGNTDITPNYPSCYNVPNVMSIGATDHNDEIADFSAYGAVTVDFFAPGVDILSTTPGNTYSVFSGTSMACPHTAGVAALVWGKYPGMTCDQIKALLMNTVDPKPQLAGMCVTGGRLNALFAVSEPDTIPPAAVSDLATTSPGSNTMGLTWTAVGDDGLTGTASSYDVRYSTSVITGANFSSATKAGGTPDPAEAGTPQAMTVIGLDFSTTYYFAIKALDEYGNAGPISNVPSGTTLGAPDIAVDPTLLLETLLSGGTSAQTLTVYNMAEGTLDFSIPQPTLILGTSVMQDYLAVGKGEVDTRVGDPVIEGAGGPDATGYRWIDSDEPGGPTFDWVDITGVGTAIPFSTDDGNLGPFPIGFSFEFYGNYYSAFRVCTNGWLSFTSTLTAYDNQPLPNAATGVPENLVAPFWDDLTFVTAGDAYYYNDGARLIVEWVAVPHYSSGGPYTFEAILYPNGEIVYQYLSMATPTNSTTVGTQNSLKTDGLNVAFNTDYVHDNMAIRISKVPQWVTVAPASGTIGASGSLPLSVNFDSEGLLGGYFYASILINSNDPDEPTTTVPVTLHVLGAPDIDVSPLAMDFGSLFVGATKTANLVVSNPGTDQVNVSSIVSDNSDFTVSISSFSVPPRGAQTVVVSFRPSVAALRTGTLTVNSNDPDEPVIVVSVQGTGLVPPQFVVTPNSLYAALLTGQAQNQAVTIRNNGGSNLIWSASVEMFTGAVQQYTEYIEYPKGVDEPSGEPQTQGAGGPDVFGYKWIDSDQTGGPTFNWVEISGVGTSIPLTGDDQNPATYPIGFTFPFYTGSFSSFRICTNGWVSFSSTSTAYSNTNLPNSASTCPKDLLAIFWDDLTFSPSGGITPRAYYYYDGLKTVIEFQNARKLSGTGTGTFEIILYPNGKILYQYQTMSFQYVNSATVGIQNTAGNDGLSINYNTNYAHSNLAILIAAAPEWLKITPKNGTIAPGGLANVTATFNATDLFGGEYLGAVHLASNDPNVPVYNIPAHLDVTGAPDIAADPASLNFGSVFLGYGKLLQLRVMNMGTDMLNVHDIVLGSGDYTVDQTAFSVPPLGQQMVNVVFTPSAVGDRSSTLTIMNNDADEGSFVVPLVGAGLIAPDIAVDPTSLSEDLYVGETSTQTVRVDNTGGSDLNFLIGVDLAGMVVQHEYVEYAKDEADPNTGGPQLMGFGGPDVFGYRWVDSDEPGGPIYDWVEISGIGTPLGLNGDDQNIGPFNIGFEFPFYGTNFTTFRACSNGWLSFTSTSTSLSNSGLPSTGAPLNLLAPFWDDLNFASAGQSFYYYDGIKTVIEYKNVPHYGTTYPGTYTFEVILYPSGRIVYQYQSMVGTLDNATIGIQNATGTDGLQVVYNASYVRSEMAVELLFMPEWLTVAPSAGTIPAGGFVDLAVGFDANDMFGGNYEGGLSIRSNDPDEGLVNVDCFLHVTGAPDIDVAPLALDYGWLYIGLTRTLQVKVSNAGTDLLDVTSIAIDNPEFTIDTTPFTLAPRKSKTLDVVFTPATPGTRTGILSFFSNDADEPEVQVSLTGEAVVPPEIEVDPTAVCAAALPGMIQTKILEICNTGGSDLNWDAGATQNITVAQQSYLELGKDEVDPRPGILGTGGPDAFGYRWVDNGELGGPTYDWVEITGVGTRIFNAYYDDQNSGPYNIGFDFGFYGNEFSQFWVCTNGWITFTSPFAALYTNQPLPNSGAPANLLAAFWDDMVVDPSYNCDVYYYNDGMRLIVQYDVRRIAEYTPPYYSFEVILYPDGNIVYQYRYLGATTNSATIGIQNATKDDGLMVVYNAAYAHEGLAILFSRGPEWLSIAPESGVIPAGGCQDVTVTFNASALEADEYTGNISIQSNDLDEPVVIVPVTFNVGSTTALYFDFDPNVINLASNGTWVDINLGLPAGFDIADVLSQTFFLATGSGKVMPPARYEYSLEDGIYDLHFKFDREALEAILTEGDSVEVMVGGEIDCITYLVGYDTIRVIRPRMNHPNGGEAFSDLPGITESIIVAWESPSTWHVDSYSLYFSADGGTSWQEVATGIANQSYITPLPEVATTEGLYRVYAYIDGVAVGYDSSDEPFTILRDAAGVPDTFKPTVFALSQNWPNPFSGGTSVLLDLPKDVQVKLGVYDVSGRLVKSLVDQALPAGRYNLGWNGRDANGREVASGVYFYNVVAGSFHATKRMVVVK